MRAGGWLFAFVLGLAACTSVSLRDQPTRGTSSEAKYRFPLLTFDKLLEVSKKSSTVEAALKTLRAKYPEYMLTHTLVYDSLSVQQASFEEPRAIVFGPDAKFVFSFNGHPNMRGGAAFETMEFDEVKGEFQFREIVFKKQVSHDELSEYTPGRTESQNQNVIWTKANTDRCTQCHGENPSPIFETYFIWPGFYGSNDDFLTTPFVRKEIEQNPNYRAAGIDHAFGVSQGRDFKLKTGAKDVEVEGFKRYLAGKRDHPRYSHLPTRGIEKGYYRWMAGEAPQTIDISDEVEKDIASASPGNSIGFYGRPNLDFMENLMKLMAVKFQKQMSADDSKSYSAGLISYLETCSDEVQGSYLDTVERKRSPTVGEYIAHWSRDPLRGTEGILSEAMRRKIRKTSGDWRKFYKSWLLAEIALEGEKIARLENSFGKENIYGDDSEDASIFYRPTAEFYSSHLGKKLNRFEKMAAGKKTDGLYAEARRDYVARGLGVDLGEYVTNLRRVTTFREGGFQHISHLILRDGGYGGYSMEERAQFCGKMKSQLVSGKVKF